jgi:SAM-dependent methyltransferase
VLDIGCGTGALLGLLPNRVTYLGVEIDPAYVDAARARFGEAGEFVCSDIGSLQLPSGRAFDLAIAYGVFHHLDDDTARRAVDVAATALADGGRFVIMEPCWVPGGQGWFERFLMGLDRGRFVRTIDDYAFLAATRLESIATHVVPDTCRLPYTMVVVEGCAPGGTADALGP